MLSAMKHLWKDECGLVFTAELALIGTLSLCAAGVGFVAAANAIENQLTGFADQLNTVSQQNVLGSIGHKRAGLSARREILDICGHPDVQLREEYGDQGRELRSHN
jgi:hypothetical protein